MELTVVSTVLVPAGVSPYRGQEPFDLVGLAAVKAELEIEDGSKDTLFKNWITQASAAAAKFCDRVFPIETIQDQIFPPRDYWPAQTVIGGVKPLLLSRRPIATAPSLAGTPPPIAPTLSAVSGGALAAAPYYVRLTYVTPTGETACSVEAALKVAANNLLVVASPVADRFGIATGWNCYVGGNSFGEVLQNVSPLPIGAAFTLPVSGLTTAAAAAPNFILAVEHADRPLAEGVDFISKPGVGELVRLDHRGWPERWPAVPTLVQYPAGYTLTDPRLSDLVDGVTRYVKGRYFAQLRDPALRSENIEGAYQAQYWFASGPGANVGNLPPDIEALWEKYRAPVFG